MNPAQIGTKAAVHYRFDAVPAGGSVVLRLRLTDRTCPTTARPRWTRSSTRRRAEADEFYAAIHPPKATRRRAARPAPGVRRPALDQADLPLRRPRLAGRRQPGWPPPESRRHIRNPHWRHLNSMRIMSVPDKWEYPWFAAWDLAFHCVAVRAGRSAVRQGPALAAAVRAVPAPQRPDPGLRVGVLRPQSAGPRVGRLAGLQHGPTIRSRQRPTATSSNAAFTSC